MKNLTRRAFVGLGASAAVAVTLAGCSSGSNASSSRASASSSRSVSASAASGTKSSGSELRFMTGGQSGTYYSFGQLLAQHATNNAGVAISALTSDGSKANVESIEDDLAEFGFCQSDVMAYAYNGTNLFKDMPFESISTVAALYDEQVQIVTCNSQIKTVADLKGKRVSIGAPNSGVYFNAIDILSAYDIRETDFTPTYQSFGDSADSLKNEQIDAAFIVAGAPTAAITDLSTSKTAYLVALDDEHVSKLLQSTPYYTKATIKAGTYPGQTEDITTVAVSAVILASKKASNDDVYAFVKDIFDSAADATTAARHAKYEELSVEKGASITSVPYHPGAAKFFEEKGIKVETK
ncbi:MAG: TAXI family TRAP transporter solute-binding subunit [Eggerthellaceae bacterium]|nr:TAXI family TRAP transporter solute-binding subunit [Eggerthellaceae bacterium]